MRFTSLGICCLLILGATTRAFAQTVMTATEPLEPIPATKMLSIGAGFAGGAAMVITPAENWKVAPVFAYRATVDMSYPFTKTIGAALSFGIDRRGGEFHWYKDVALNELRMINYFAIIGNASKGPKVQRSKGPRGESGVAAGRAVAVACGAERSSSLAREGQRKYALPFRMSSC